MDYKGTADRYMFKSAMECLQSHYTNNELEGFVEFHKTESISYAKIGDYENAVEHDLQAMYIQHALILRELNKQII